MVDKSAKSPNEEDNTLIRDLKASLRRATFHKQDRDDSIIVYSFDNLSRGVLIQWIEHMRSQEVEQDTPLRILYDLRGAGPPSRFLIDRLPEIIAEMEFPEDVRSAFLVDDDLNGHFTRSALSRMPESFGITESFLNLSPAIKWLNEELS